MGLLDSILSTVTGQTSTGGNGNPLLGALGGFLEQSGGIEGLMGKFSQAGLADVFSSWVGLGENKAISAEQIQQVLGSSQIQSLAQQVGIDPARLSSLLAEFLPKVIDKLTPTGEVTPGADVSQGLAGLFPALLKSLMGHNNPPA